MLVRGVLSKDFSFQRFDSVVHLNGQYWLKEANQIMEGSTMALLTFNNNSHDIGKPK